MAEIATGSGAPDDLPGHGQPAYGAPAYGGAAYGVPAHDAPSAYVPPAPGGDQIASGAPDPRPGDRRGAVAKGAGLLVAGVLVGVLGVTALQHDSTPTSNAASTTAVAPGQQGQVPGSQGSGQGLGGQGLGGQGLGGGVDGETRTVGTVTAVGGSSVTVKAQDGTTATYRVTGDTQIARNGAQIALSDVRTGETVLVHVLPGDVAERVLIGTFRRGGGTGTPPGGTTSDGSPDASTTADTI
jgi:hypothetical protein